MADCRRFESDTNCTLTIIGEEDEVVKTAAQHAEAVHGHENTPELQQQIRDMLESESGYVQGERQPEPFPA
jgi:hypothetical protein